MQHEADFGIEAKQDNNVTAHVKGKSDDLSAVFKREAATYSLICKPNDLILTCEKLFNLSKSKFSDTITTFQYTKREHQKMVRHSNKRFEDALAVPQILKNHVFFVQQKEN